MLLLKVFINKIWFLSLIIYYKIKNCEITRTIYNKYLQHKKKKISFNFSYIYDNCLVGVGKKKFAYSFLYIYDKWEDWEEWPYSLMVTKKTFHIKINKLWETNFYKFIYTYIFLWNYNYFYRYLLINVFLLVFGLCYNSLSFVIGVFINKFQLYLFNFRYKHVGKRRHYFNKFTSRTKFFVLEFLFSRPYGYLFQIKWDYYLKIKLVYLLSILPNEYMKEWFHPEFESWLELSRALFIKNYCKDKITSVGLRRGKLNRYKFGNIFMY